MSNAGISPWKGTLLHEDYDNITKGRLELYPTTFQPRWFVAARESSDTMITHFQADTVDSGGIAGFFDTSDDHETLITCPRELQDNASNGLADGLRQEMRWPSPPY